MGRFASPIVATLLALAAACARSPTGPESLRLDPATPEISDDTVILWWLPPAVGDFDGYVLEWRAAGSAFATLETFEASALGGTVWVGPDVPDAADIELRLRALPDPHESRSASLVVHRRPRPALFGCVWPAAWPYSGDCAASADGFHLQLENRSPGASKLVLRSWKVLPGTTALVPRPPVDLPPDTRLHVDKLADGWAEEATFAYQLVAVKNGEESWAWTPSAFRPDTAPLPLAAPVDVTAVPVADGVQLSFVNRSARAECIAIELLVPPAPLQTSASCLEPPPVGATGTFVDRSAALSGSPHHLFRVRATSARASSFPASIWEAPPASEELAARLLVLPPGAGALRLASGEFATLGNGVYGPGSIGPVPLREMGIVAVAADTGTVFALLRQQVEPLSEQFAMRLASLVGDAWGIEELGWAPSLGYQADLDAGPDGVLRAAWLAPAEVVVASRTASAWTFERVPAALPYEWTSCSLAVAADETGVVHVVHAVADRSMVHRHRTARGWASQPIPGVSCDDRVELLAGLGPLTVVAYRARSYPPRTVVHEGGVGGWTAVETLEGEWRAARSADGLQVALASPSSLRIRSTTGTRVLGRPELARQLAAGVGADGKAWVLDFLYADPARPETTALLYEER